MSDKYYFMQGDKKIMVSCPNCSSTDVDLDEPTSTFLCLVCDCVFQAIIRLRGEIDER